MLCFQRVGAALLLLPVVVACTENANQPPPYTFYDPDAEAQDDAGADANASADFDAAKPNFTGVRIANLNCHNLYNDVIDSPETMAGAEAESTPITSVYQAHLKAVAQELVKLGGDVVMLQEVENLAVLGDLQRRPELGGKYGYSSLITGNDPRGIDIAVLSKYPLRVVSHKGEKIYAPGSTYYYYYARDVVETHVTTPAGEFVALGIHYRSQISSNSVDDDKKRLAEANGTRQIADKLMADSPSLPIVVLGDFNSTPDSPPGMLIKGASPAFTDVSADTPVADRWSITYSGKKLLYDTQWVNPVMWGRYVKGSAAFVRSSPTASDHSGFAASYSL